MNFDLHTHTTHSDGKQSVFEMCESAIARGMHGIAITDHANVHTYDQRNLGERMPRCYDDVKIAKEKYGDQLKVLMGVEVGEYAFAPDKGALTLTLVPYDVVLCSVHFVPTARWDVLYSRIDFSDPSISDEEVADYMHKYFETLAQNSAAYDYDVLAHITCPARYITGRHHRPTDVMKSKDLLEAILKNVIAKDASLEYNTCGVCCESFGHYNAQNEEVFKMYKALGGKKVTLGSDAHAIGGIGRGFEEAKAFLRSCGFENYCYYENRIPHYLPL